MKFSIIFIIPLFFYTILTMDCFASELLEDVQYLLSAEETMDYDDPKLNEILNKYDYKLFKAYKAFIEFDRSEESLTSIIRAQIFLIKSMPLIAILSNPELELKPENIKRSFLGLITHRNIANDLVDDLPEDQNDAWTNGYKYIKIPLWLVMKYPELLNRTNGPYTLIVNSNSSARNIEELVEFFEYMNNIHCGYISPMHGNMARYLRNLEIFQLKLPKIYQINLIEGRA